MVSRNKLESFTPLAGVETNQLFFCSFLNKLFVYLFSSVFVTLFFIFVYLMFTYMVLVLSCLCACGNSQRLRWSILIYKVVYIVYVCLQCIILPGFPGG